MRIVFFIHPIACVDKLVLLTKIVTWYLLLYLRRTPNILLTWHDLIQLHTIYIVEMIFYKESRSCSESFCIYLIDGMTKYRRRQAHGRHAYWRSSNFLRRMKWLTRKAHKSHIIITVACFTSPDVALKISKRYRACTPRIRKNKRVLWTYICLIICLWAFARYFFNYFYCLAVPMMIVWLYGLNW